MTDAAILASTNTVKTLADGSMRLTLTIEPRHAVEAFTLFGQPGIAVALAKLTPEAAISDARKEMIEDGHGKAWAFMYRRGTFFSAELNAALGVANSPGIETTKQAIYTLFDAESLTEIDPIYFRNWCINKNIEHILPKEF